MCINCNLLTPLTDEGADILGVPRRTYLVYGCKTINLKYGGTFTNDVYNYKTCNFFSVSPHTMETIERTASSPFTKEEVVVKLYKGNIHVKGALPLQYKPPVDADVYSELFDAPLEWVENPPIPTEEGGINALANAYKG